MATLNPLLKNFWIDEDGNLKHYRNRVLYGGRASSKSWEFAGRLAQIGQQYKTRVLCVRRFQNKIKDSVYTLIKNQINNFNFSGYDVLSTSINHLNGSEFVFYGIERNLEEIKSFEGANILWIEEAHNLTNEQWKILEPTIRLNKSEIWISFNPRYVTDFIYQNFIVNTPKNTIIRKINYDENKFLSDTILDIIESMKTNDRETYDHVYGGKPLSNDEAVLIRREWIEASIDFHLKFNLDMKGEKVIGYDIADDGDDKNATTYFDGNICFSCDDWKGKKDGLKQSTDRVRLQAINIGAHIVYDSIGVGAHTGSTLKSSGFNKYHRFNANGKVYKPNIKYHGIKQGEYFSNIKSQSWWIVADLFRNVYDYVVNGNKDYSPGELISISSKISGIESLISELSTPRRDFDKLGKVKVESKDDLKARHVKSPNKADSFIMAKCKNMISKNMVTNIDISGF